MRNLAFFSIIILFCASFLIAYEVGDVVDDFTWLDSDGGEPVERTLYEVTAANKILFIGFGATWCPHCVEAAPILQEYWEEIGSTHFHLIMTMQDVNSWDAINGSRWRTRFTPNLTFFLSIASALYNPYYSVFGNGYIPYIIVIDTNNVLRHSGNSRPTLQFLQNLIAENTQLVVYRFFNTLRGGHLYTSSEIERDYILQNLPEWSFEGPKFEVQEAMEPGTTAVYRFFNNITGIHFYTISEQERDEVMQLPQWNYEGVKFYLYPAFAEGTIPVYRFFNHARGGHLYTISEIERDAVMQLPDWDYEGIAFYVLQYAKGRNSNNDKLKKKENTPGKEIKIRKEYSKIR